VIDVYQSPNGVIISPLARLNSMSTHTMQRSGTTEVRVGATPEQVQRLHRLGRELRLTDQILTDDVDRVAIVATGSAPAWTSLDGQSITFALGEMPEPTSHYGIGVWLGTNAHEVGHSLFSPRGDSPLMRRVIATAETSRPHLAQAHNIVEDQRQERLLLGRFAAWRGYLVAALAHHIDVAQPGAWVLLAGRTWLSDSIRAQARAAAVAEHGDHFAAEVERIVGAYQTLTDPGHAESAEAFSLCLQLDDLLADQAMAMPTMPSCTVVVAGQPDLDDAAPAWNLPATADEAPEADDDDEGDDDEGEPFDGDDLDEGPSGPGDGEVEQAEATTEADAPTAEGAGNEPGQPPTMQDQLRQEAEAALDEQDTRADLERVIEAVEAPAPAGETTVGSSHGEYREATDHARALERDISEALLELKDAAEAGWLRRTDSGRLNVRRWMTDPSADYDQMFDRFDPGALDAAGLEVVVLTDVSGSMMGQVGKLAEAVWSIRQAVDRMEGRCTVFTFTAQEYREWAGGDQRPDDRMFVPTAYGGTDPAEALYEAHRIIAGSEAPNRIVLILTDGEWNKGGAYGGTVGGTDQQRAAMEALNAEGACTALAVLGASASAADPDHGQQITRRLTNLDGLALLFREVASRMIEERLSA